MIKVVQITIVFCLIVPTASSQHFLGMHSEAIKVFMDKQHPDFNQDNSFVNKSFNYLKFIDDLEQQTWLFFLDDNNYCKSSKLICDYALLDEKIAELNNLYEKTGDLSWTYKHRNTDISVTLKKEEWFFSILTKPKED